MSKAEEITYREATMEDMDVVCDLHGACLSGPEFPLTSEHPYWTAEQRAKLAKGVPLLSTHSLQLSILFLSNFILFFFRR